MGTSISQSSPRNTNWSPVHAGYQRENIPESRIINEIWRASENEDTPISAAIKSKGVFDCYSAVTSSNNISEAIQKYTSSLIENKNNSIITEFAKRSIPTAFQSSNPGESWAVSLFSEITNYVMSRDVSGFVGDKYRNKTIRDLVSFKKDMANRVANIISAETKRFRSQQEWNSFVDKSIDLLKRAK